MPVVHFQPDTLPRVERDPGGARVDLVLPFRFTVDTPDPATTWVLRATVNGTACGGITPTTVTHALVQGLRDAMQRDGMFDFDHLAPYLAMEKHLDSASYVEYRVPGLQPGVQVTYALEPADPQVGSPTPTYGIRAAAPEFGRADIRRIEADDVMHPERAWVLYHQRAASLHHVRIDVATLVQDPDRDLSDDGIADLAVTIGERTFDLRDPRITDLPIVDLAADSVVVTVPADGDAPLGPVKVRYLGLPEVEVDPNATVEVGRARTMFVNFAIQGLNDYFERPDELYTPARTYTQVTMRDEKATFSSRPGSLEDAKNRVGDGYAFTLQAHRRYGIKQMWAMNGGLAVLLAHDCPDDLEALRRDVASGLVQPVVAGFGAHRIPYYATATNVDAVRYGIAILDGILGAHSLVYYPDSRIYAKRTQVSAALARTGIEYLVVDAEGSGNLGNTDVGMTDPPMNGYAPDGQWVDFLNLWRDADTGLKILFIDPEMKDQLFGATEQDALRGKASLNVREKFLAMAAQPLVRRTNLLVYSDDADKASGNGWFDGAQNKTPMNRNYQATLSWIARHPWVEVVTTDDLTEADCVGTVDLQTASDPYMYSHWPVGGAPMPGYDFHLRFDTWYTQWAGTRAAWLGENLDTITQRAENALAAWPVRNRLVDLARLYVTMCLHESQWSKITRSPDNAPCVDPEDFVVAESVHLRNAHVYLAAAVWADWAASTRTAEAFRDSGPVIERVTELEQELDRRHGVPPWRRPGCEGLQWDHDPLPCVVLYNAETLVVIDRNGGRITHLFAMVDGRPYSVSGTFKAYQFLDVDDWSSDAGFECDGAVLQNTVYTPNHAYMACDVDASLPDTRPELEVPPLDVQYGWAYPDNFNAYDIVDTDDGDTPSVTFQYQQGTGQEAPTKLAALANLLEKDRNDRLAVPPGPGVVLHNTEKFGAFRKTIRLAGNSVHVEYADVPDRHEVANEVCVDLWSSVMRGSRQERTVAPDQRSITYVNGAIAVKVALDGGAAFHSDAVADLREPTPDAMRLHRVLTDDARIVADGPTFRYSVTPSAAAEANAQ